jgi:ABC-type transport system involved in multi-copper enzyme maturation permease subunit
MMKETKNETGYWAGLPYRGFALITLTLKQILLNRYVPIAFLFLMIPTGIGIYTIIWRPDDYKPIEMFVFISLFLYLQFFVLLYTLIFGSSLLHDEMDKKTMTYLLIRSSKRLEIVIFKYIGLIISINILFIVAISVSYFVFAIQGESSDLLNNLDKLFYVCLVMFLGSLAYGAFFTFLSIFFKRPLMVGLLYAFIWEIFITNIPMNIRRATMMYYLRSVFYHQIHSDVVLEMFTNMETVSFSVRVILIVMIVFVGLSCWLMTRKEVH